MALLQTPKFSPVKYNTFEIPKPCSGGINLLDLEYEQEVNQSPNVLNMMYRNGAFGKRYGQEYYYDYKDTIYDLAFYDANIIIHAGSKVYKNTEMIYDGLPSKRGLFINFNRMLYYIGDKFYVLSEEEDFKEVEPYVPDVVINRKPDGTYADTIENYNRLGTGFKNSFHGDGESKEYILTDKELDEKQPIVEVDGEVLLADEYTADYVEGKITFNTAPPKGTNNVVITIYKTEQKYIDTILSSIG